MKAQLQTLSGIGTIVRKRLTLPSGTDQTRTTLKHMARLVYADFMALLDIARSIVQGVNGKDTVPCVGGDEPGCVRKPPLRLSTNPRFVRVPT